MLLQYFESIHECSVIMLSVAFVCLSVLFGLLTFESLDLETSLLVCSTSSHCVGHIRISRSLRFKVTAAKTVNTNITKYTHLIHGWCSLD